jgi:hypothetical protein
MQKVFLGKRYRDIVSGFDGIVTSRHEYLNGCVRVSLTAKKLGGDKKPVVDTFDVQQLKLVDGGIAVDFIVSGGTISLGKCYRDAISGFEGIAASRHEYLNGSVTIGLVSKKLADAKPVVESFDIGQLKLVDEGVAVKSRDTGGPGDVPAPRYVPKR